MRECVRRSPSTCLCVFRSSTWRRPPQKKHFHSSHDRVNAAASPVVPLGPRVLVSLPAGIQNVGSPKDAAANMKNRLSAGSESSPSHLRPDGVNVWFLKGFACFRVWDVSPAISEGPPAGARLQAYRLRSQTSAGPPALIAGIIGEVITPFPQEMCPSFLAPPPNTTSTTITSL